jgi:hypothetical protein
MLIRVKPSALKQTRWSEYAVRFALGGLATVLAGLVAKYLGPEAGGLFLAFPAIFCASATLIEKHERERKTQKGLRGTARGVSAAALDAAGAAWASAALALFAVIVWTASGLGAPSTLGLASAVWLATAVALWFLRRKLRLARNVRHRPFL